MTFTPLLSDESSSGPPAKKWILLYEMEPLDDTDVENWMWKIGFKGMKLKGK